MKNTIPYSLLITLLIGKAFAWWLLFFGTNILDAELTLSGMFEPIHQFSYLVLSTILLIGILFSSRFSLVVLALTAPTNLTIYLLHGTSVYQSVWDPVLLAIFLMVISLREPNRWAQSFRANTALQPTSGRNAAFRS